MAHLGEFGAAQHEQRQADGEKDDFVFCGELFEVQQRMPPVLAIQLGAAVSGKIDETEGFAAVWEALRVSLTIPEFYRLAATHEYDDAEEVDENGVRNIRVPEDDAPFRKWVGLAVTNKVELEDLLKLVMRLFEEQTGRPTRQAPASSAGPPSTLQNLNTSSHLRSVDSLLRGEEKTLEVESDSNVIQMGDGELVEVEYNTPTGQTG